MANARSFTALSNADLSLFSSQRRAQRLTPPPLNLTRNASFPNKLQTFSGLKKTRLLLFSRFHHQIAAQKTLSSDQASFSDAHSELQLHTKIWNWRGYSIRYQYCGTSGPALVLIHGFGANSDHWRKNIPVLAKSHRVYSIDLIGYGYSDKPNPRQFGDTSFYTFETWASQLNEFCKEVVKDEAFFICNSIGGVVGLQAAVMEPMICKGIMLLNISLRMLHIKKQPWYGRPFIRSFQNLLRNTAVGQYFFKSVATPEAVRNILCQCYHDTSQVTEELVQSILRPGLEPGAADVFLEFICYSGGPLPEELLPLVKCPVLIAWGDKDPWEPLELGRAYANFDSVEDFVVLPNVGHCPQVNSSTSLTLKMGRFKRVCVFCGSNSGNKKIFSDAALDLGRELVERKIDLVYGGGSVGLMGLVSQTVYDGGCHVLGIIPKALVPVEISGKSVGEVLIVSSMHERKAEMASRADAFIALPGGYGTMEELLEIIAWSHLGIHGKPVGVLNVDGYYDGLLGLFDKGVEEGFINPSSRTIVLSATTAAELINKIEEYIPQHHQVAPTQSWNVEENHNANL